MQLNYGTTLVSYRFRHEPDWLPAPRSRPRGVEGRTTVFIEHLQPDPLCPYHFSTIESESEKKKKSRRDACTCAVLVCISGYAYCSKKEPPIKHVATHVIVPPNAVKVQINVEYAYDPAVGRLEAFKDALMYKNGYARQDFSEDLRRVLWRHFLTTCKQPVEIPARKQQRIYRKLTLKEAEARV